MKRLWIAVAIILLLVFGCVGAELSVEHGVDGIMSELELAHAYAGENRIPEAEEQAKRAEERWVEMDLFERRNFLGGSDFGSLQEKGTVKRTSVSNMEIWCECFGKERANLRRTDSNELTGILARLGWKRADNKVRIPLYGPQYVFVPKGCSK